MIKSRIILLAGLVMLLTVTASIIGFAAEVPKYTEQAEVLKDLGLFSGSDKGFELDRAPTRVEAAAMLVKLLGKEAEAKEKKYKHPFTDVPSWANFVVGYMYENKLTTGIGNNMFGSSELISARDFSVFILKSLGYTMTDFEYSNTLNFGNSLGLIDSKLLSHLNGNGFKRDEMVLLAKNALELNMKSSSDRLIDVLVDNGAVSVNVANTKNYYDYPTLPVIITGNEKTGMQIERLFSEMPSEIYANMMNSNEFTSNGYLVLETDEEMSRRFFVTEEDFDRLVDYYNREGSFKSYKTSYYKGYYGYTTILTKDLEISHYYEYPRNLSEGRYEIALIPVSDKMQKRLKELQAEYKAYYKSRVDLIEILTEDMFEVTKGSDGYNYFRVIRENLPENIQNYYSYNSGFMSTSQLDLGFILIREFIGEYNGDNIISDKPEIINSKGEVLIKLMDKDGKTIGAQIINIQ